MKIQKFGIWNKKKKKKYTGKPRGFAYLKLHNPEKLQELCAENGRKYGRRWTPEEARRYALLGGRKGKKGKKANPREGSKEWRRRKA